MMSRRECRKQQMNYACQDLCPTCGNQTVGELKVGVDWTIFPSGVRFNPSDAELLEHLLAKVGCGSAKEHPLIDDFIMTLNEEDGICRIHPENLPGVKKDGSACHYFYRPSRAYNTGTRKRRKIQTDGILPGGQGEVRWHKTGKTRPILQDGKIQGFKKIMVLYRFTSGKKSKNMKTNWVMHQYHMGKHEEERDGEIVVCKVFLQKQPRKSGPLAGGQKKVLSPIDDEYLGEAAASESDSGFEELLFPPRGFKSVADSPSVSGVTREIPPVTPKSYHAQSRLQAGNHLKLADLPIESISGISLHRSFDPHAKLAIQFKPKALAVKNVNAPDNGFGGGKAKAYKVPNSLAPNKIMKLGLDQPARLIFLPTDQHNMADDHSIVAGNLTCHEGDEGESFQTINLDEDHLPWELAINHEAQAISEEDLNIECDDERLVLDQVHCNQRLDTCPGLLQKAPSFGSDHNWQRHNYQCAKFDPCVGHCMCDNVDQETDEGVQVDPALDNIVLDTPPDMFEVCRGAHFHSHLSVFLD